jgi:hypothetical protein
VTGEVVMMTRFRRVDGRDAGPSAVGILIPPGRRTILIVRPRALAWDLLPLRSGLDLVAASPFHEVGHQEAPGLAQELQRSLETWADDARGQVEVFSVPRGEGYQVRVRLGAFLLIACDRDPGRPYQPALFATLEGARKAASSLAVFLRPDPGGGQELYVNTRNFTA